MKKIFFVAIIILCCTFSIFLVKEILFPEEKRFYVNGLLFEKTKIDKIDIYYTSTLLQTFYFRNDPRKLKKIPFDVNSSIEYKNYVSYTPEALECKEINLAAWSIGSFFGKLGKDVKAGITETIEGKKNATIINCTTHEELTIILKAKAKKTRIYNEEEKCIIIEAKNCEVLKAVEGFIFGMLVKMTSQRR
ncbi:MAG: hypothetical protein NZ889_01345 [Candidatus Pacearchaeota archaeon]|nr:hypothetical protein [Candidatus Pacearchaeota archaeon]